MKTKLKRIFYRIGAIVLITSIALLCIDCSYSNGNPYSNSKDPYGSVSYDSGWIINSVYVQVDVNKDKTAHVTENYVVHFKDPSYAFDRYLPLTSGERYCNLSASAVDFSSLQHTRIYEEQNYIILSVELDKRIIGEIKYTLSYDIIPKSADKDIFYMNVIGQGWTTTQNNVKAVVNLPYSISEDSLVYYGAWGSTQTLDDASISYKDNSITITKDSLPYGNGITVILKPTDSFGFYFDFQLFTIILAAVAVSVILLVIYIFRRQPPVNKVINFYPPNDENGNELTPVDMGVLIDRKCDDEDVASMIFYWASKGAIKIKDKDDIVLTKTGELPANSKGYEKLMFDAIFKGNKTVTVEQLKNNFYMTSAQVKSAATAQYAGIYNDKKTSSLSKIMLIISELIAFALIIIGRFRITETINFDVLFTFRFLVGLFFTIVLFALVYVWTQKVVSLKYKTSPKKTALNLAIILMVCIVSSLIYAFFFKSAIMSFVEALVIALLIMISAFICALIMRHSDAYNRYLEQILGFKEFLTLAEKDKLEALLEENPEYYYDILPYANVLGVSDIWEDKFKELNVAPPKYYGNDDVMFNMIIFNNFYRNAFGNITRTVAVPRSSTSVGRGGFSGGGFGGFGGGFSGGGFGGGGGGRR